MNLLTFLTLIYFSLGLFYAVLLQARGACKIWEFPINVLFGPPLAGYVVYMKLKGKKLPLISDYV